MAERTMRRMTVDGIDWSYRPGFVYTAQYRGLTLTIRRVPGCKLPWRLSVNRGGGGSLAFSHQFWPTVEAARAEGKRLADFYAADPHHNPSPTLP